MSEPIPDKDWYISKSNSLGFLPRCPFATAHDCPRYYQSLSLLGNAGCTKIEPTEDNKLLAKWKKHALWPHTLEQATGISSRDGEPHSYHHFCPEVAYDTFGYFAKFLARYADEIDSDSAHERLNKEGAKTTDPRWFWQFLTPQHYSECPLYSPLARADELSSQQGQLSTSGKETRPSLKQTSRHRRAEAAQIAAVKEEQGRSLNTENKQVLFISYAHCDSKWLTRFQRHLKPLLRGTTIDPWSDRRIKKSDRWHEQIQTALTVSCAAVLFVSPDFLASEYIADYELPVILKGAAEHGVKIFPVIISPCAIKEAEFKFLDAQKGLTSTTLSVFQAANPPTKTLSDMKRADWERVLLDTAKKIANLELLTKASEESPDQRAQTRPEKSS